MPAAAASDIQRRVIQQGQDTPAEAPALVQVRVARQDERFNAHIHIALELGSHLDRITNDGRPAP
jgi:hypothetical protein